jgi:hypothetical protein
MRLPPLWMQGGSYRALEDRRLIGALWPAGGFSGMAPTVVTGTMDISIAQGVAVVPDNFVVGASYLCASDAPEVVELAQAPPSGQDRIDLVCVQFRDSQNSGANNDWIFQPIQGTPSANPVVPPVPAGMFPVAQQRVVGGSAFITAANLTDRRPSSLIRAGRVVIDSTGVQQIPPANAITRLTTIWNATPTINDGAAGTWVNGYWNCITPGVYRVSLQVGWVLFTVLSGLNVSHTAQIYLNNIVLSSNGFYVVNLGAGVICHNYTSKVMRLANGDQIDFRVMNGQPTQIGVQGGAAHTFADIEQLS